MKNIILAVFASILVGCGGAMPVENPDVASSRPAVPCQMSAECRASVLAGEAPRICAESFMGQPAVMMSTWDNGTTWLRGNCDSTNQ